MDIEQYRITSDDQVQAQFDGDLIEVAECFFVREDSKGVWVELLSVSTDDDDVEGFHFLLRKKVIHNNDDLHTSSFTPNSANSAAGDETFYVFPKDCDPREIMLAAIPKLLNERP